MGQRTKSFMAVLCIGIFTTWYAQRHSQAQSGEGVSPAPSILHDDVLDRFQLPSEANYSLPPYIHAVTILADRAVHVLWAPFVLPFKSQMEHARPGHAIRSSGQWTRDAGWDPGEGVAGLSVDTAGSRSVVAMWCQPAVPYPRLKYSTWVDGAWDAPQEVASKRARPSCYLPHSLSMKTGTTGSADFFWLDSRETILLRELMTGEGDMAKVFHRSVSDGRWTKEVRVQDKGPSRGWAMSTVREEGGRVHVFWSEISLVGGKGPTTRLMHAFATEGRWGPAETLRTLGGDGSKLVVNAVTSAVGKEGDIDVAWIVGEWKEQYFEERLEIMTRHREAWGEARLVTNRAASALLASSIVGGAVLLYQECTTKGTACEDSAHVKLHALRAVATTGGSAMLLAPDTMQASLSAVIDGEDHLHMTTTTISAQGEVRLRYLEAVIP